MADTSGRELLSQILRSKQSSEREAMSYAAVANFVENGQQILRNGRRHNAQSDAYLKAKFKACGMEDAYQPPEETGDDLATMINCTFNGDKAVSQISKAVTAIGTDDDEPQPVDPGPVPPPPPAERPNRLLPALGLLAAVALGSGLTFAASQFFGDQGEGKAYDIVAVPYIPAE